MIIKKIVKVRCKRIFHLRPPGGKSKGGCEEHQLGERHD